MNHRLGAAIAARRGMSLIEMLVATAASLMLMAAVAQVFSVFGSAVTNSRSMIELDARMRTVAWRLRSDLAGVTARTLPPLEPSAGEGYLEIIEGPNTDNTAGNGSTALAADTDDILLFTTRSNDSPFLGKAGSDLIESPTAEVAWFLRPTTGTSPQTYTLFRRQLLVVGYAGFAPFLASGNNTAPFSAWNTFYDSYDISVRREGSILIPNTLSDLTRREARFMHNPNGLTDGSGFPHTFNTGTAGLFFNSALASSRVGEDVVLTNVIAFDIRVFDPAAAVSVAGDAAATPGDAGFSAAVANGCYVDIGNANTTTGPSNTRPRFQGFGTAKSQLTGSVTTARTWDTWSTNYETNGINEDASGVTDQGADGFDNNADGQVDECHERGYDGVDNDGDTSVDEPDEQDEQETSPPYPYPLRGVEIRIRCYEPSSRQVRQATVRHTFVPH
jgi:prepilin-type N-terminal cleavage/methylation domain-containing protein